MKTIIIYHVNEDFTTVYTETILMRYGSIFSITYSEVTNL
jgi:hypothetical protein